MAGPPALVPVAAVRDGVEDEYERDAEDHVAGLEEGDEADAHGQAEEPAHRRHEGRDGVGLLPHVALDVDVLEVDVDDGHVAAGVVPHRLPQLGVLAELAGDLVDPGVVELLRGVDVA